MHALQPELSSWPSTRRTRGCLRSMASSARRRKPRKLLDEADADEAEAIADVEAAIESITGEAQIAV